MVIKGASAENLDRVPKEPRVFEPLTIERQKEIQAAIEKAKKTSVHLKEKAALSTAFSLRFLIEY